MRSPGNPRSSASCATADGNSFLPLFLAAGGCVTTAATWNAESGELDAANNVSRTEAATWGDPKKTMFFFLVPAAADVAEADLAAQQKKRRSSGGEQRAMIPWKFGIGIWG